MSEDTRRAQWRPEHVVDVDLAASAARTYYEHRDLRRILADALSGGRVPAACELGAGFGRMTPLLAEVADHVVGFEREPELAAKAKAFYPTIEFHQVEALGRLPAPDAAFALGLTFTVLQHVTDAELPEVTDELRRVLRPGALLVTCEETDRSITSGDVDNRLGMCTIGRPAAQVSACFPASRCCARRRAGSSPPIRARTWASTWCGGGRSGRDQGVSGRGHGVGRGGTGESNRAHRGPDARRRRPHAGAPASGSATRSASRGWPAPSARRWTRRWRPGATSSSSTRNRTARRPTCSRRCATARTS